MHIIQSPLFDFEALIAQKGNARLVMVLEALDAEKLLMTVERERWTGRKGYSRRGMWAALIAGLLHQCRSLAEVIRLLEGDKDTRTVCGFSKGAIPSEDALGRFLKKLVRHQELLEECFADLVERLRELVPGFGPDTSGRRIAPILRPTPMDGGPILQTRMHAGDVRELARRAGR